MKSAARALLGHGYELASLIVRSIANGLGVGLCVLFFAVTSPEAGGFGFEGAEPWWHPYLGCLYLAGAIALVLIVRDLVRGTPWWERRQTRLSNEARGRSQEARERLDRQQRAELGRQVSLLHQRTDPLSRGKLKPKHARKMLDELLTRAAEAQSFGDACKRQHAEWRGRYFTAPSDVDEEVLLGDQP